MSSNREKVRNSFPASSKLEVVKYAEQNNKTKASKQFGVYRERVQEWCKQKEELKGRGHKLQYPDIEEIDDLD